MRNSPLLMTTLESFDKKYHGGGPPAVISTLVTATAILVGFWLMEGMGRVIFYLLRDTHELLSETVNQQLLARYVVVDAFACATCSVVGWRHRKTLLAPIKDRFRELRRQRKGYEAWYAQAMRYDPVGFRIALFFFAYQVKDMMDAILWEDDVEYIVHHIFSILTAWGVMYPGFGQVYAPFYFGMSEVSTTILCLLALFDKIEGLEEAFPTLHAVLGVLFAILFIFVRVIVWPIVSMPNSRDSYRGLMYCREGKLPLWQLPWFMLFLTSITALSIMQIFFTSLLISKAQEVVGAVLLTNNSS